MEDLYVEFKAVVQAFNAEEIPYAVCGGALPLQSTSIHGRRWTWISCAGKVRYQQMPGAGNDSTY